MRITQIMLSRSFGGAERSFVDTSIALAERGHRVQAICHRNFSHRHLLENIPNLQLQTIWSGGEWCFVTPYRIAFLIRRFRAEMVHTQLKRAAWHGGRGAYIAGVPVVSKLHNYVKLKRYRYVHTLIGTTRDQRKHVLALGWPEDRVTVIPNFSRITPVDTVHRPGSHPLRLLTYGRYVYKKGFDVLLQAFQLLIKAGVDAVLTIGGSGPEATRLVALAKELGISDHVCMGEWIDDVAKELDCTDVFVLPSRDEPFGIVMLEAMARGVPIVTTRTQGPSQVLTDQTAYFVQIDSVEALFLALQSAINHPEDTQARAGGALELYRTTYYVDAVLPKLEALYRSACGDGAA